MKFERLVTTCAVHVFRASESQKMKFSSVNSFYFLNDKIRATFELEYMCSVFTFVKYRKRSPVVKRKYFLFCYQKTLDMFFFSEGKI